MKSSKFTAAYRRLRTQALWKLLASDNGPAILGLLQAHLYESERSLPGSIFHDRIGRELEELRANGETFPQTTQGYIAGWLAAGYLERRFPPGATEEEYELSTATLDAIRFVSSLAQPHSAATESRLTLVITALTRLAEDTDADKQRRIDRLVAERKRIEAEIAAIEQGKVHVIAPATALERTREIISLADELAGDFRQVRDRFEQLNRELRERIVNSDGSRGEVLDSLFAGIDLIAESEEGRTFSAFWRLLTNPDQTATLDQALDNILSREFVSNLDPKERRFLLRLTRTLLEQGGAVHEVLQAFARSLKHFVQSREYLEQRRLHQILKEAQRSALALKETVHAAETLQHTLELTSCRVRSITQWVLHDPELQARPGEMAEGAPPQITPDSISEMVALSEIDFRVLRANIRAVLEEKSQASIGEILACFPAEQGLGSIVGLMALGSQHGAQGTQAETVEWTGEDGCHRSARIPTLYFLRERTHELD